MLARLGFGFLAAVPLLHSGLENLSVFYAGTREEVGAARGPFFLFAAAEDVSEEGLEDLEGDEETRERDEDEAAVDDELDKYSIEEQFHMSREELEKRMQALFPMIDSDNDAKISESELLDWLKKVHERVESRQGNMEFDGVDEDHDGVLTPEELKKAYFGEDGASEAEGAEEIQLRFKTVDRDADGKLTPEEFGRLLRVSEEPELLKLEVAEILKSQDTDKDGKIAFEEFKGADRSDGTESDSNLRTEFDNYDKDKSGFIDPNEVEAIIVEHSGTNHQLDIDDIFRDAESTSEKSMDQGTFMKHFEALAGSKMTDFGELLRFPTEYKLGLPFKEVDPGQGMEDLTKEEL